MGGSTDDDSAALGVALYLDRIESGISAVPMSSFCPGRHEHLGVLAWVDGGAGAVFVRCSRQWYAWRTTEGAAQTIDLARQSGTGAVRLLELTLNEPGNAELWRMFRASRRGDGWRDGRRLARALREWS